MDSIRRRFRNHQVRAARSDQQGQLSRLRVAWRRPAVDPSVSPTVRDFSYSNNFRATPPMIGGLMCSPNGIGLVEAFHPGTGKTLGSRNRFPTTRAKGFAATARAAWRIGPTGPHGVSIVIRGEYLIALDPAPRSPYCAS